MDTTTDITQLVDEVASAIRRKAALNETPLRTTTESIAAGAGLRRKDMTPEERRAHDSAKTAARARKARKAKARREETDARPEPEPARQVAVDTFVVAPLVPLIDRISTSMSRRYRKVLGDIDTEVGVQVFDKVSRDIARSKWDTDVLIDATELLDSEWWMDVRLRDYPEEERTVAACAKYLIGVITNSTKQILKDEYTRQPTVESIHMLDTIVQNQSATFDPDSRTFSAPSGIRLMGWSGGHPGKTDYGLVGMAVAAAITEHRLDPAVEVLLNDDYRNTDGSFGWTEHGIELWKALGLPLGPYRRMDKREKSSAVRLAIRNRFAWLPLVLGEALRRLDPANWETPRSVHISQVVTREDAAKQVARLVLDDLFATESA